ncbi:GTPase [Fontivita pretiosa]|uniref:GTPase n=1 Tax=Fontivita pretiosa TaxID=2989684 RepID=UPI003D18287F
MPANLTPDYERAEQRYRSATTDEQRLEALREMFATIPKHKGTEKLQADIKRRISQLRKAIARKPARGTDLFHVPRGGAGQVVLVGPPNTGKSLIVARTTHAPVKVADYPFSTALPVPGMAQYQDVQIELVDTPPLTADHIPGGLLGTIRNSDIIAIVVDAAADPLEQAEMVASLLAGRGLVLRSVPLNQLDPGDFNQHCAILVANKIDLAPQQTVATLQELYAGKLEVLPVSAATGEGLDRLLERCWQLLSLVRVYTKQPGKPVDKTKPFTLEIGSTVEDLAREIHQELPRKMTFARIWGDGRFAGQQVHRTEILHDRDIVEIHQ